MPAIEWCLAHPGTWLMCRRLDTEKAARVRASAVRNALKRKGMLERIGVVTDGCEMFVRARPVEDAS